jgi:hypothetical protein
MFKQLHSRNKIQLLIGSLIGFGFGFLLQKGGVTKYEIIMAQLLLTDFTVLKVMLTAVFVGMIGIYTLKSLKMVSLHPKPGSLGATVIGGLIFGIGFGLLGYCPGTVSGAAAQGSLDALLGGVPGMFIGVWIYSKLFPKLQGTILDKGSFGKITFPELFNVNAWIVILLLSVGIILLFLILEKYNL